MTVTIFLGDRRQTTDILKRRFLVFNKSCRGSQRLQTLWKVITSQLRLCKRAVCRRREAELLCKARAEACGAAAAGLPDTSPLLLRARGARRSSLCTLRTQFAVWSRPQTRFVHAPMLAQSFWQSLTLVWISSSLWWQAIMSFLFSFTFVFLTSWSLLSSKTVKVLFNTV